MLKSLLKQFVLSLNAELELQKQEQPTITTPNSVPEEPTFYKILTV